MPVPELYAEYDRKAIHDQFDPSTLFIPQRGTWGLHGIIPVPEAEGSFVLIVTFGRKEAEHSFDEGISVSGVLRWQSQPSQDFADDRIKQLINHENAGGTVHLFLRTNARTTEGITPYTYLGTLSYAGHNPHLERPVHMMWQLASWPIPAAVRSRMGLNLEAESRMLPDAAEEAPFDPTNIAEGRDRTMRSIRARRGQRAFRNKLLEAWNGRCAVTGCEITDILEAAHIVPYRGPDTNHVQNGILLRSDLHTLFDCGLISVDPVTMRVVISPKIAQTNYHSLNGRRLRKPREGSEPSKEAILLHRRWFGI